MAYRIALLACPGHDHSLLYDIQLPALGQLYRIGDGSVGEYGRLHVRDLKDLEGLGTEVL